MIDDCDLPLKIQEAYIGRLKRMIELYEFENICLHCPANIRFANQVRKIKIFRNWSISVCTFCKLNVHATSCPCHSLDPEIALKRAKNFIEEFGRKQNGRSC